MFYGVRLCEGEYDIIEGELADELFCGFSCEAVFNDIELAEAYKEYIES